MKISNQNDHFEYIVDYFVFAIWKKNAVNNREC